MAPTDASAWVPERRQLLGLPVHTGDMDRVVAFVARSVAEQRATRAVVTNANKSWLAARDAELRRILEQADLVISEYATAWAAGFLGVPDVHHVGGITLMLRLLDEAAAQGWSVYLLGAEPGVAEAAAERVRSVRPALRVVGTHHGYLDEAARRDVEEQLTALRPDLLFVAMGSPLQEYAMASLPEGCATVMLGVGGSLDVLAGRKKDAPEWARGRGLEWAYRLAQDPQRMWRRYLVTNTWFVGQVLRDRIAGPRGG
jgi:N-acetylglucosaminyldiphosphoundecaprenol N-acetyl-beta-D-mannosaminyltransferase